MKLRLASLGTLMHPLYDYMSPTCTTQESTLRPGTVDSLRFKRWKKHPNELIQYTNQERLRGQRQETSLQTKGVNQFTLIQKTVQRATRQCGSQGTEGLPPNAMCS